MLVTWRNGRGRLTVRVLAGCWGLGWPRSGSQLMSPEVPRGHHDSVRRPGPLTPVFTSTERLSLAGFLAGYSGLTRQAYELDLRQYASWCQQHRLHLFGARRERRQLKHRAVEEIRPVPISPALARLLRDHLAEYDTSPDGRLFRSEAGDLLSDTVCTRTWEKARQAALTPAEAASPLAERPYDLRHARLSTWLNAGVAPAQVAEWAGNSVPVLLRVCAKCLTDSEQKALKRIEYAEAEPDGGPRAE
jgi:hypothetical protein